MSYSVVIPARYGSTRLPGKPLLDIGGKPMVQRVYEQARLSRADRVVIATDDQRIVEAAEQFGAEAVMTDPDHASGTDRLAEVAELLGLAPEHRVVNVQGDEPLIPPQLIDQVADNLASHETAGIATLCEPLDSIEDVFNPNCVKVVTDHRGYALYFSRASIPFARGFFDSDNARLPAGNWYRHIGIYGYRVSFLKQFVGWEASALEQTEQLEQLRALHHGVVIHVACALCNPPGGVDTEADLEQLRAEVATEVSP